MMRCGLSLIQFCLGFLSKWQNKYSLYKQHTRQLKSLLRSLKILVIREKAIIFMYHQYDKDYWLVLTRRPNLAKVSMWTS